jgi:hypothetical protein
MRNDLTKGLLKGAALVLVAQPIIASQQAVQPKPPQTRPEQQTPAPPRLTLMGQIRKFMPRVGATVDESKSAPDMIVSNYNDPKGGGKLTIVIVNDRRKQLLGFYVYNFGSVKNVKDREEIYKYLLGANDAITIGSFFVDTDLDVGYKYLISSQQVLDLSVFQSIYVTMAAVARERKPEIAKLIEAKSK